jgi:Fe-Mn family superoxide dismutase
MSSPTRRDVLTATLPALATLAMTGHAFAQDGAPVVDGEGGSPLARAVAEGFKDGKYALPPLPYAPDALEPHIDAQTMQLHHGRHHQAYVNNLNNTIAKLTDLQGKPADQIDAAQLSALQRDISFNAGGHILHTVFWAIMAPNAGGAPRGAIGEAIGKAFGSFESFKTYFTKVAAGVKGSGWAIMTYEPIGDALLVTESGDQDLRMVPGAAPLLAIDVWEHAYYLKYQNRRADYINAWWNVVNWPAVDAAYVAIRKMYGR